MIIEILAVVFLAWGLHQHSELRRIRLTDKSSYEAPFDINDSFEEILNDFIEKTAVA